MWGLGALLLLLGAGALRVSQAPGEAGVMAGDEVALECRVLEAERWDLLRLEWARDGGHGVLCAVRLNASRHRAPAPCAAPRFLLAWHPPRATLTLLGARGDDAGRYLCRVTVEIPRYSTATGNGTLLRVGTAAAAGHQSWLGWGLVGALGGTALLLGLGLLGYRCWCKSSDTDIYLNTLPPSLRAPRKPQPPPRVTERCIYREGLQGVRPLPSPPKP